MDLTLQLAGDNVDLNGPVALPICIIWAVACGAAGYYRWRLGPGVGHYNSLIAVGAIMAVLQLVLFVVAYVDLTVAMARQVVAALGTLLLSWMLTALLGSWSDATRYTRVHPLETPAAEASSAKEKWLTADESSPTSPLPKLSLVEPVVIAPKRLSQFIPSATAPYRNVPPHPVKFAAYQGHASQRRLRSCMLVVQLCNAAAFLVLLIGRAVAIFGEHPPVERPFAIIGSIVSGLVILTLIATCVMSWQRYRSGLPPPNTPAGRSVQLQAYIKRAQRQLWLMVALAVLLLPRSVSLGARSLDIGIYIASEGCTAIWLFIALLPGTLAGFTENPESAEMSLAERGLVPMDERKVQPEASQETVEKEETPIEAEERKSKEAWRRTLTFSSTERTDFLANTLRASTETRDDDSQLGDLNSPPPRFNVTARLARTHSTNIRPNTQERRTSFAGLKRAASMAIPRSLANSIMAVHAEEASMHARTHSTSGERKRWTIDMNITQGESLSDIWQRELGLVLPRPEPAAQANAHPGAPALSTVPASSMPPTS
ncbi:hypothetical protein THASP1DRAFT_24406 [Thamnocephalis sphaerospora]|uniref:Uncharacterized protein n=1 Tax=Thamnocephalis sphaerospora TaxID=78915 RepID=A0A4P9XPS6_9FUNG|nr:hypothetical protein THASP1DRAFT_24406 [Thamnocephalis sphaerospora]|eukprot:RKP07451.1 hypothetical protein THASP1DRAFT_24406 [Thamnocephalis sphaerospora]